MLASLPSHPSESQGLHKLRSAKKYTCTEPSVSILGASPKTFHHLIKPRQLTVGGIGNTCGGMDISIRAEYVYPKRIDEGHCGYQLHQLVYSS